MMLLNQVFQSPDNSRIRVVLEHINNLMLIDIDDKNAWPYHISEENFHGSGYKPIKDPYPLQNVEEGSSAQVRRDEAYQTIKPLLTKYVDLFDKKKRNQLISNQLKKTDKTRLYITRHLRRYWQRGMAPNALAPDYHHCGGKGKSRREIENKPGRKRSITPGSGVIINEEIADIFTSAIEGFFLVNNKLPLVAAKNKAIAIFKSTYPTADESSIPTMAQFRYFFHKNYTTSEVTKKRTPKNIYDKDISPLLSTAGNLNIGPGSRYEIDATIADIYIVSNKDPDLIIGRPVIYFVKDVFSRMVVGLYVGLENPSWVAAMIAIANAFSDKVRFCQKYGIDIDPSQWPSLGIPEGIMADRAELMYRQADALVNRFNIKLSNARAYRGDDKAICERTFNTVQAEFRPYVKGIVEPINGKKRIGRRYELDAELSLSAFTEIIIHLVINHNTRHVIDGYDFAPDMPTDLPAIPLQLWNWGVQNRTGKLRYCDEDLVKINLLPHETGTVSELGITFKGLKYTCQQALKAGWFDRIPQNRPSKVEIGFDPRRTYKVYLRPDNSYETFWTCELTDRSRRFKDMCFVEAAGIFKTMRKTESRAKQNEDFQKPDVQKRIEEIASRERAKKGTNKSTKSERLHGIRENRLLEKEDERSQNSIRPKSEPALQREKAEIIDINSKENINSVNLDYPNLDDLLEYSDD